MKVEILYFEDCPNYQPLLARIPTLLHDAGIDADVALSLVDSEPAAQQRRFLGSPTVRIDGRDVDPGANARTDYGLKCRLYRTAEGITAQPPDSWIITAARDRTHEAAGPPT